MCWLPSILDLLASPYVVSLAGCQALLLGKPRSQVLLALAGGSEAVQAPAASSPSCAAGSLSPSHTADEWAPPPGVHRHYSDRYKYFTVSRTIYGRSWWWVWLVRANLTFLRWDILFDCVVAGGADHTVHGKSCREEVGFLDGSGEDWGWKWASRCCLHHQAKVYDALNNKCEIKFKHKHTQTP